MTDEEFDDANINQPDNEVLYNGPNEDEPAGDHRSVNKEIDAPDDEIDVRDEMIQYDGERIHAHGLRPRRPRDYSHLGDDYVFEHTMLTQYSLKKGLREFGEDGVEAVLKELKQLHVRKVIAPVKGDKLSREERRAALAYLMFLKKKRCGTVKGRGCADGRKQRATTTKEEASSPTSNGRGYRSGTHLMYPRCKGA